MLPPSAAHNLPVLAFWVTKLLLTRVQLAVEQVGLKLNNSTAPAAGSDPEGVPGRGTWNYVPVTPRRGVSPSSYLHKLARLSKKRRIKKKVLFSSIDYNYRISQSI